MFAATSFTAKRFVQRGPILAPFCATMARAGLICVLAVGLSGCASVSIPFANFLGEDAPQDLQPVHTASIQRTALEAPDQTDIPPQLNAAMPVETAARASEAGVERPADDLISSLPRQQANWVSLTQADLNAMGRALTHVLASDADVGTFAWSHEATGRAGLMTPFRTTNEGEQGRCRVVSVEITDSGRDTILLADACLQGGSWVFVTPRAGEVL